MVRTWVPMFCSNNVMQYLTGKVRRVISEGRQLQCIMGDGDHALKIYNCTEQIEALNS